MKVSVSSLPHHNLKSQQQSATSITTAANRIMAQNKNQKFDRPEFSHFLSQKLKCILPLQINNDPLIYNIHIYYIVHIIHVI